MMKKHSTTWLTQQPIAHRGLHDEVNVLENSLLAFSRAVDSGYAIELDARVTKDGVVIVFHDDKLERMTGVAGKASDKNFSALSSLVLKDSTQRVPSLAQVLELIDGRVPVIVEVKVLWFSWLLSARAVRDAFRDYDGDFVVSSFHPLVLRWLRRHAPAILRGQNFSSFPDEGVKGFFKKHALRLLWRVSGNAPDFFCHDKNNVDNAWITGIRAKTMKPLLTWGITSPAEHERVKDFVDNVMIEDRD